VASFYLQLQVLENKLQSETKTAQELRGKLSQVDKELEGRSSQVRELEKGVCELRLDYKNERKRVDLLLMQRTAATIYKERYTKEIEVHQDMTSLYECVPVCVQCGIVPLLNTYILPVSTQHPGMSLHLTNCVWCVCVCHMCGGWS